MIRLDQTTRSLEIVLGGVVATNQLPVTVSYSDKTSSTYSGATQLTNTNSGTAVTIASAPAASTVRDVDYISVRNSDTASATITIRYNDNTTLYTIITATLAVGDQLVYTHGNGWETLDSTGNKKTSSPNYQPLDAGLTDISGLAVTDGNIIVGDGTNWVAESGVTARTSLGLGTAATQNTGTSGTTVPLRDGTNTFANLQTFTSGIKLGAGTNLTVYDEGTLTPVASGDGTAGTATYTNQSGTYTREGNLVTAFIDVGWSAHTGTGNLVITGLPYTSSSSFAVATVYLLTYTFTGAYIIAYTQSASSIIFRQISSGAGASTLPLDTTARVILSITYRV